MDKAGMALPYVGGRKRKHKKAKGIYVGGLTRDGKRGMPGLLGAVRGGRRRRRGGMKRKGKGVLSNLLSAIGL
jgi:hypothetical protein